MKYPLSHLKGFVEQGIAEKTLVAEQAADWVVKVIAEGFGKETYVLKRKNMP